MKKYFLLIIFISILKISFAQNGEHPLPFVQQEPKYDTAPRFPGGSHAMMKYLDDSIRYPEPERTKFIQGNVMVKFSVTKEGRIIDVQLVNGVPGGPNLARESVRIIQSMPTWIPASKNGKPVEAEYNLSVPFKIKNKR
ncbi:MAG: energy transducer TonB [Bacteroidota bacterium]|nr:energy transducer TonB [Bacteroidota bacterium]